MNKRISLLIVFAVLLPSILMFSGCGKTFEGPYAAQMEAAYSLRSYKDKNGSPVVNFYESYEELDGRPALVLHFSSVADVPKITGKIKEKFEGLDIPWLITNFEDVVFEELKDNDLGSLGLVISGDVSGAVNVLTYVPPLDDIDNLTGLDLRKAEYKKDEYPAIGDIRELTVKRDLSWLEKYPNISTLNISELEDMSLITNIQSLREITTDDTPLGEAVAYALYMENPSIEVINGEDADSYDFGAGLSGDGLDDYNTALLNYNAYRMDLTGYREISFDEAEVTGGVSIAGYGEAVSVTDARSLGRYLTDDEMSRVSCSPQPADTVIRITTDCVLDDNWVYSNGRVVFDLKVYAEVIDTVNMTTTGRHMLFSRQTDSKTVVHPELAAASRVDSERLCSCISELMAVN